MGVKDRLSRLETQAARRGVRGKVIVVWLHEEGEPPPLLSYDESECNIVTPAELEELERLHPGDMIVVVSEAPAPLPTDRRT